MQILEPGPDVPDLLARYANVDRSHADGRCWVMANMVGGLDGSAAIGGRVGALSGGSDRALFRALRSLADVVLVGAETVRRERYRPVKLSPEQVAARLALGRPATPPLAVVSRSLDLDYAAACFADAPDASRTLILTGAGAQPDRLVAARAAAEVLIAGHDGVEPDEALRQLAALGHRVVLCEGGPRLLGQVAAAGRLDELCLTIAPLMGGDPLPLSVAPPGAPLAHFALRQAILDQDTLFLRYERNPDERNPGAG